MRVKQATDCRLVLIAYTNHALDHMLEEILEAKITSRIVRLGSRSSNERVAEYSLDRLEKMAGKSMLDRSVGKQYRTLKGLEEDMDKVMKSIQIPKLTWNVVEEHLMIHSPHHLEELMNPPFWIHARYTKHQEDRGSYHHLYPSGPLLQGVHGHHVHAKGPRIQLHHCLSR